MSWTPGNRAFAILAAGLVLACASEPNTDSGEPHDSETVMLSESERLVRISMAIRGRRPGTAELEAVSADPSLLPELVDEYLESDDFGATLRDLYNEALKLRVPASLYPAGFAAADELAGEQVQQINVSVTEAPLRLIEHVIRRDRPIAEIVTADYVLADGLTAKVWGLPYSGTGQSWEETRYQDGRRHAGVLSDSWLYTRHSSTFSNKNRGRANAIARGLLCQDFTERSIEVDATINLADPEQVANAIETNPTCVSCHQTLDPLAGFFGAYYPLFVPSLLQAYPFTGYVPELGPLFTVSEPGYFGYPGGDVAHLGQMIAEDPRFYVCQTKRFYAYFRQLPLEDVSATLVAEFLPVLTENGSAKELVRAIVLDPSFSVSHRLRDDLPGEASGMLKARPWQLAHAVADLTGFRWQTELDLNLGYGRIGRIDVMTDSLFGFEVVAGGIDSVNVALPSHTMTAPASLVLRALAARAAEHVVDADLQFPGSARLFTEVRPTETEESAVRAGLAQLQLRVLGQAVAPDSAEVDEAYALFQSVLQDGGDAARAWKMCVFALLQHPRFVFY